MLLSIAVTEVETYLCSCNPLNGTTLLRCHVFDFFSVIVMDLLVIVYLSPVLVSWIDMLVSVSKSNV